ncbi:similar to Saccharomyces cerevisiae YCR083W TRX3 Mitochondrial thioredoxin, highly conserved oxidoreductase required to maintain the redox homeostasis of the cell,forms the mitochondrial thioredoxin [Geotrichum candidum]|nr:similar to Saccharomyces cerevisiae YCR083W TRX3 Mitochondrial thioredoxin, highly conserved oxidoreductase required to maintain the redox homeostasis of the cell,forms the mitochondrial thioredoxin [Geotrichum candidum]
MLKHITTRVIQSPLTTALRTTRNFHSTTFTMVKQVQGLENFKKEIASPSLTVVDFYATWCGPCKMVAPVIEKLSETVKEANFIKVDVDESPDVASEYGISAMPTFMFFKNGEKIETVIGANVGKLQASVKALV